jgi:hypothetical protein
VKLTFGECTHFKIEEKKKNKKRIVRIKSIIEFPRTVALTE